MVFVLGYCHQVACSVFEHGPYFLCTETITFREAGNARTRNSHGAATVCAGPKIADRIPGKTVKHQATHARIQFHWLPLARRQLSREALKGGCPYLSAPALDIGNI